MGVSFNQYEKDLALDVLGRLDQYGWWGGTQSKDEKHMYCLGQAVVRVLQDRQELKPINGNFSSIPFCRKLVCHVNSKGKAHWTNIPNFNDSPSRTYEDIQSLLKEIATWENPTPSRPRDSKGSFAKRESLAEAVDKLIP